MNRLSICLALLAAACGAAKQSGGDECKATPPVTDTMRSARDGCQFQAGAHVRETLGISDEDRAKIPIKHVIVVTQENRSFDHYFGKLSVSGQPDAEGPPASWTNPDTTGGQVAPHHLTSSCVQADPPHGWSAMHAGYNNGAMDGFVKAAGSDGAYVMGYYDQADLPFYYWLANTFAISDRYFCSVLGPTWPNRDFLYAGTSGGVKETGGGTFTGPTIFDSLDTAGVTWGVYSDGNPRQDALGWNFRHTGFSRFEDFLAALADGSLPAVTFVDPGGTQDEHPRGNIHNGEAWGRQIYEAAVISPLWHELAIVYTYDESGGFADHVPPPAACIPSADQPDFDHMGPRVPMTVISPWSRKHYVSHQVHEHGSTLRFIELLHDLPALTARDANSDALLDLFDFGCEAGKSPPTAPEAGAGICEI